MRPIHPRLRRRLKVGATWLWLLIPIAVLTGSQMGSSRSELDWQRKLAHSLPDNQSVQIDLIDALVARGRHLEAIEWGEEVIRRNPGSDDGFRALLNVNAALGRNHEALEHFERILQLRRANADDYATAATLLHGSDVTRAVELYRAALNLDTEHFAANMNLASALAENGDFTGARSHLLRARSAAPGNASVTIGLAQLDAIAGDAESAVLRLQEILSTDPANERARRLLREIQNTTINEPRLREN